MNKTGIIYGINGPVIYLKGDSGFKISEMVYVGKDHGLIVGKDEHQCIYTIPIYDNESELFLCRISIMLLK